MEKRIKIVKRGEDDGNLLYWISLSEKERMAELERMREIINREVYGAQEGFQRVCRVVKRTWS